jgi:hypothetical protein
VGIQGVEWEEICVGVGLGCGGASVNGSKTHRWGHCWGM